MTDFLKQQAEEHRSVVDERRRVLPDWQNALDALMLKLTQWLQEADPEHLLTIENTSRRIRERQIGSYLAPGLRITFGAREVRVEPIARYSIGPIVGGAYGTSIRDGRVDMTNDETKSILYRLQDGLEDRWVIVNDEDYLARDLDRPAFEAAIQNMLE